ncbi:peptidoglycan recognition protein family protein [Clostridium sp.]|uniref:peptidoglycan recognition protein family protein n=1 Tax=Clostridium sp. TaxID=1506 RepID=UPI002FCB41AB
MTKKNYEKLRDIENFYKKKASYAKLMRKRRRRTVALILVGIIVVVSGAFIYSHYSSNKYSAFLYSNKEIKVKNSELEKKIEDINDSIDVKEVNYTWGDNLEAYNVPKRLIIHHSASKDVSPETIHKWHLDKGYGGIGYHYYIRKDGIIYRGRDEKVKGAHTINENSKSIGICLEGNYEVDKASKAQIDSLVKLGTSLTVKYNIEDIVGHRDCNQTLCPGKNIDIHNIKSDIASNLEALIE